MSNEENKIETIAEIITSEPKNNINFIEEIIKSAIKKKKL